MNPLYPAPRPSLPYVVIRGVRRSAVSVQREEIIISPWLTREVVTWVTLNPHPEPEPDPGAAPDLDLAPDPDPALDLEPELAPDPDPDQPAAGVAQIPLDLEPGPAPKHAPKHQED